MQREVFFPLKCVPERAGSLAAPDPVLLAARGGRTRCRRALPQTSRSRPQPRLQEHPESCLLPDSASKEEQTMQSCHDIFNDESFS